MSELFAHVNATPGREFLLRCSYLELYNENLRDLLVGASVDNPSGVLDGNHGHNNHSNSSSGGALPSKPGSSKHAAHHSKSSSSNNGSSLENSCNSSTHSSTFGKYYGSKKHPPVAASTMLPPPPLKLMDDCESGVIVSGLREVVVCSPEQAFGLIGAGEHARQVSVGDCVGVGVWV